MNFNLSEKSAGRKRITKIFDHNNTLFVVSKALGEDIQRFIGKKIPYVVIPNIVETSLFASSHKKQPAPFILSSVNFWSEMKNPFVLVDAIKILIEKGKPVKLILGGEGVKFEDLKTYVANSGVADHIQLTGNLSRTEVADLLVATHIYLQSSNYETFSVICMEALATGTPVLAHNIGGMKEFVSNKNGRLVDDLSTENWVLAIEDVMNNYASFDGKRIAQEVQERFSAESVGKLYYTELMTGVTNKKLI